MLYFKHCCLTTVLSLQAIYMYISELRKYTNKTPSTALVESCTMHSILIYLLIDFCILFPTCHVLCKAIFKAADKRYSSPLYICLF